MDLKPGQLSALAEMGIPVWELRQHKTAELDNTPEHTINSTEIDEQLLQCDWLILIDKQAHNEQAQRLLQAMLSTIGLSIEHVAMVTHEQVSQLQYLAADRKMLLAFGTVAAQLVLDEKITLDDCRGKTHQVSTSQLTTVVSFGLEALLNNPENKVLAWQDLQLAKLTHQQLGQR
jgi:DNA polymerase III psi subunit